MMLDLRATKMPLLQRDVWREGLGHCMLHAQNGCGEYLGFCSVRERRGLLGGGGVGAGGERLEGR
jgi:hypothetical protein